MLKKLIRQNKNLIIALFEMMQIYSVRAAAREQKLDQLSQQLLGLVPDITDQYTSSKIDSEGKRVRARTLHAFQIKLALKAIDYFLERSSLLLVDIGDSSGTHLTYLKAILAEKKVRLISVNLDPVAVEKIRSKGIEAILCRAEDFYLKYKIRADLFLSFEMLEHLSNPISFLDVISKNSTCDYFVITVPYLEQSRVGLHHIRHNRCCKLTPEQVHILELSPTDWKLIFKHSGWVVVDEMVYRQYPVWSLLRLMKPVWKYFDFEGFYGVILKRERTWAECYQEGLS